MWFAFLAPSALPAFGDLRNHEGMEVAQADGFIILRTKSEFALAEFRKRPCDVYLPSAGGLSKLDENVPRRPALPENLAWLPLRDWWQLRNSSSGFVVGTDDLVVLDLVRATAPTICTALLTHLEELTRFAHDAPELRLAGLKFAVATDGLAWVEGGNLPPLPGQRFTLSEGIACPNGFRWAPKIPAASLRKLLGIDASSRVILAADGSWESIQSSELLPATRSNIRASYSASCSP